MIKSLFVAVLSCFIISADVIYDPVGDFFGIWFSPINLTIIGGLIILTASVVFGTVMLIKSIKKHNKNDDS